MLARKLGFLLTGLAGPDPFIDPTSSSSSDKIRKGAKKSSSKVPENDDIVVDGTDVKADGPQAKDKAKRAPRKKAAKSKSEEDEVKGQAATEASLRSNNTDRSVSASKCVEGTLTVVAGV